MTSLPGRQVATMMVLEAIWDAMYLEAAKTPRCSWIDFTGIWNISLFVSIAYNQTPDIIVGDGSQQRIPIKINMILFGGGKKTVQLFFAPKPKNAQINGGRSGGSFHRRILFSVRSLRLPVKISSPHRKLSHSFTRLIVHVFRLIYLSCSVIDHLKYCTRTSCNIFFSDTVYTTTKRQP